MTVKITTKDLKTYPLVGIDINGLYVTIQTDTGNKTILISDIRTWKIDSQCPVIVTPKRRRE